MLKALKGFSQFFTNQRIMIILVIAILGFALYSYGFQKDLIQDNMEGEMEMPSQSMEPPMPEEEKQTGHKLVYGRRYVFSNVRIVPYTSFFSDEAQAPRINFQAI